MEKCPCGSGSALEACCAPIVGGAPAPTAEALMRSRYTAYVLKEVDHIERTHAAEIRDTFSREEAEELARAVEWSGLEIRAVSGGGTTDDTGTVEFISRYKMNGQIQIHHEKSAFRREDGQWVYVDGEMNPKGPPRTVAKVGRNEPCPCGSGKKYKKCCGA